MRICLLAYTFLSLCSCAGTGKVLLIRHGEKSAKASTGDIHLNQIGEIRAHALAHLFFPELDDVLLRNKTFIPGRIHGIVAQPATQRFTSMRKMETAAPIVERGKLDLVLFEKEDLEAMSNYLIPHARDGNNTIVIWDHTTISDVANSLLDIEGTEFVKWPLDRYDVIWIVDPFEKTLFQYCQELLYGDLRCPDNPIELYPRRMNKNHPELRDDYISM